MDQTQRPQLGPFCPWSPPDADNWPECPDRSLRTRILVLISAPPVSWTLHGCCIQARPLANSEPDPWFREKYLVSLRVCFSVRHKTVHCIFPLSSAEIEKWRRLLASFANSTSLAKLQI
ncbi:hypothetical protein CapIbe_001857 [Capra ibex]